MKAVFEQLKVFDNACAEKYQMPGEILMEHAGRGLYDALCFVAKKYFSKKPIVQIVCGGGDNGADGLVLARLLYGRLPVRVVQVVPPKSALCKLQTKRLALLGIPIAQKISECDILLDAFLGTGFKGSLRNDAQAVINTMNDISAFKIACDIPSGLNRNGIPSPVALKVHITLSAGALKLCFFSDAAKDFVGRIHTIPLGLADESYAPAAEASAFVLEKRDMKLPFRKLKNTHKGMFGHAGIYCGEKEGAAVLAGLACLKFGAGLVSVCGNKPASLPPDLMYDDIEKNKFSSYCIGPGLGTDAETMVENFFKTRSKRSEHGSTITTKVVFDADALKTKSLAEYLKCLTNCIITPHPKEFVALLKNLFAIHAIHIDEIETLDAARIQENRFYYAKVFSQSFPNIVLILKGANTIITQGEKIFIATAGTTSLSKAGSGDVLAGMLTALLAQGYDPLDAGITACLAHGYASRGTCSYSSTASELIARLDKLSSL